MAQNGITQTIVGNIGNIYDLRHVGKENRAVVDFSVAVKERINDGGTWKDGETIWKNCTAWGKTAENIVASFRPGDRALVVGYTKFKPGYTNKEGIEVGPSEQVVVDAIGVELSFDAAHSDRVPRDRSANGNSNGGSRPAAQAPAQAPAAQAPAAAPQADPFGGNVDDIDLPF